MAEPGVIADYLARLAQGLPPRIVEELADGLGEAYECQLARGLPPADAAAAAVAQFGEVAAIAASFAAVAPARRAARILLAAGPMVGGCWGAVLIAGRAWDWPIPSATRVVFGVVLIAVIVLLATAAYASSYRRATQAAMAGCALLATLDAAMLTALLLVGAPNTPLFLLAAGMESARLIFTTRTMRTLLAG